MSKVTIEDVRRILVACAGDVGTARLRGDFSAVEFDELGYDSLALMETAARLQQEFGVSLPEERLTEIKTPRELLDVVNTSMVDAA